MPTIETTEVRPPARTEIKTIDITRYSLGDEAAKVDWESPSLVAGQDAAAENTSHFKKYIRRAEQVTMFKTKFVGPMSFRETHPKAEITENRQPLTLMVIGGGNSTDLGNVGLAELIAATYAQEQGFYVQNIIILPNVSGAPWEAESGAEKIGHDTYFPNANVLLRALKQTTAGGDPDVQAAAQIDGNHVVIVGYSNGGLLGMHLGALLKRESSLGQDSDLNAHWTRSTGTKLRALEADLKGTASQRSSQSENLTLKPTAVDLCLLDSAGLFDHNSLVLIAKFFGEPMVRLRQLTPKQIWERIKSYWVMPNGRPTGGFLQTVGQMFDGSDNEALAAFFNMKGKGSSVPLQRAIGKEGASRTAREELTDHTVVSTIIGGPFFPAQAKIAGEQPMSDTERENGVKQWLLKEITGLFKGAKLQLLTQGSLAEPAMHADVMHDPEVVKKVVKAHLASLV